MKKIVFKLFLLQIVFINSLVGQWCNDGADVTIQENANVHLQGDFVIQGGAICNDGVLEVGGNWTNNAAVTALTPGRGQVIFVGTNQTVDGDFNTLFNDLVFRGEQHLTLNRNIGILNSIDLNNGFVELNQDILLHILNPQNSALQFGSGGILTGNEAEVGFVRWDIGQTGLGQYEIPFISDLQTEIPLSFEVVEQGEGEEGYFLFGTYRTENNNTPFPNNVSDVEIDGINTGLNLIDRFWAVRAINYAQQPETSVDLTFDGEQETGGANTIDLEDLQVVSWDTTTTMWVEENSGTLNSNEVNTMLGSNYGDLTIFGSLSDGGGSNMDEETIVHYSLDACESFVDEQRSYQDFSEFTPAFPNSLSCADVEADNVHRRSPQNNSHSCTPGIDGSAAMCVTALNSCDYQIDSDSAIIFMVSVEPTDDSESYISGLSFYEKAPTTFDWIDGPSGMNNYPTKYGIRVLKNGEEIYSRIDLDASEEWTLESFTFDDDAFRVTESSTFVFELLGYCLVQNGANESVWDIDKISVTGRCEQLASAIISGTIVTSTGEAIEGVQVMNDTDHPEYPVTTSTDENGSYTFRSNPTGQDYTISAEREDSYINGVSTLDLVQIQRHILGLEIIDSPYKLIAADANNSSTLSASDLVTLRKLILGIDDKLDNLQSWVFVNEEASIDLQSPFSYTQSIEKIDLRANEMANNFVGIKIGDVNGNAITNFAQEETEVRSGVALQLQFQDRMIQSGEIYEVAIKSTNFNDVFAFQFTTELDGLELIDVQAQSLDFTDENIGLINSDNVTVAYSSAVPVSISNGDLLYTVKLRANRSGRLSEMLNISDAYTSIAAYFNNSFDEHSVNLESIEIGSDGSDQLLLQNYPNPFSNYTDISFNLDQDDTVDLTIYDISGKQIFDTSATLVKGHHVIRIKSTDLKVSSGTLIYRISANGFTETRKMSFSK